MVEAVNGCWLVMSDRKNINSFGVVKMSEAREFFVYPDKHLCLEPGFKAAIGMTGEQQFMPHIHVIEMYAYIELQAELAAAKLRVEMYQQAAIDDTKVIKKQEAEVERLNKVILREFSEDDSLGCEFTYVNCLRKELASMKVRHEKLVVAIKYFLKNEPVDGEPGSCTWCDMGGAGYSSKGDGHHDDVMYLCPVIVARNALTNDMEGK